MTKRVVAKKVNGSSTPIRPSKAKATIEKPTNAKAVATMNTSTTPSLSAIGSEDNDRVSILKSRFSSTILKAQKQLSLTERLKLRTAYVEEKLPVPTPPQERRSEAPQKALLRKKKPPTLTPTQERRSEAAQKALPRKKEPPTPTPTPMEAMRKAARKALEELERSVEVEDSHKSVKDLERLCGWPIPYVGGFKNRMEYYGLYLKEY